MKKFILVLLLVIGLVGCGNDNSNATEEIVVKNVKGLTIEIEKF